MDKYVYFAARLNFTVTKAFSKIKVECMKSPEFELFTTSKSPLDSLDSLIQYISDLNLKLGHVSYRWSSYGHKNIYIYLYRCWGQGNKTLDKKYEFFNSSTVTCCNFTRFFTWNVSVLLDTGAARWLKTDRFTPGVLFHKGNVHPMYKMDKNHGWALWFISSLTPVPSVSDTVLLTVEKHPTEERHVLQQLTKCSYLTCPCS